MEQGEGWMVAVARPWGAQSGCRGIGGLDTTVVWPRMAPAEGRRHDAVGRSCCDRCYGKKGEEIKD